MSSSHNTGLARFGLKMPASWLVLREQASTRWLTLAPRERTGMMVAAAFVGALMVWFIAIQPAWRTLSAAPAQIDQLDAQLQTMRRLAAEASELRNMPPVSAMQSGTALLSATERLGTKAELTLSGDGATCNFDGVSAGELQSWLIEIRSAARARVTQAQLSRDPRGYSGTIVVSLGGVP
jgi:general secretion pathway protein M